MKTTVKSIRLTPEEWAQLEAIAAETGASLSRAVAALVSEHAGRAGETAGAGAVTASVTASATAAETAGATARDGEGPSFKGDALAALAAQLATKDEQISRLMDALEASQEATRAAQTLHAAEATGRAIGPRTGRLAAWWGRLTGRGVSRG